VNQTGPLVVRWLSVEHGPVQAGAPQTATVEALNAGTAAWRTRGEKDGIFVAYHWLDERGNPIVWDAVRTPLERPVEPGDALRQQMKLRGPIPPGRYRLAVDLLEERRFWLAELGNPEHEEIIDVLPRDGSGARVFIPEGAQPKAGWHEQMAALHAEGYAAVGGAILEPRGLRRGRRTAELAPYAPGGGRHPRFPHPLVCPSLLPPLEPNDEVAGLPAYRPEGKEPWMFDGRAVIRLG
jgi:hypothetical protein